MSKLRRDLTADEVARALGYSDAADFLARRADYERQGLVADRLTGRFDPEGFERWRRLRMPQIYPELTAAPGARDARLVGMDRLERLYPRG